VQNRCLIFGSGASIKQGINLGLLDFLPYEITFGINDVIKFYCPTVAMFGDWCAYRDRFNLYKNHPLVIGRYDMHIGRTIEGALPCPKHDSLILLKGSGKWNGKDSLKDGLYSSVLTGAFTLNLAIRLGFTEIYLLGFDCCEVDGLTHWYQGITNAGQYTDYEGTAYSGVGKKSSGEYNTSFYNSNDADINTLWKPFEEEMGNVQILNISPLSRITIFPKVDYPSFLYTLNKFPCNDDQETVQEEIREILTPYNQL
jgi:hypothetical protein